MKTIDFSKLSLKDLACFICETLQQQNIAATLVGGACVSIYSKNQYQSYDLDFVSFAELKRIEQVLTKYGFSRKGRCFYHENCPYIIDFVTPPVAIGKEVIHEFSSLRLPLGKLQLLKPIDCIKDRLAAYFHWNDYQSLEQAILVAKNQSINLCDLENWAKNEGFLEQYRLFLKKVQTST